MKLLHQINLAFALMLIMVLSVTAVVIHFVLLDHFIGTQRKDMQTMGAELTAKLESAAAQSIPFEMTQLPVSGVIATPMAEVEAIIRDPQGNLVASTPISSTSAVQFNSVTTAQPLNMNHSEATGEFLRNDMFLTEVSVVPQGTLTLITPIAKIKAIEQALLGRLLLIFGAGAMMMLILSLFITKKFIKPLMLLQEELKKAKQRQFSSVQRVAASGELGSVADSVYEMAGELDRYNHAQKQFFQNASHELKSPLMSISGYAEGIRDGVFEGDDVRKGLDIIMSESSRMKNIVTEMTLLAKLDSEDDIFKATAVNLKELVEEAIERMNPVLVKKGLFVHPTYMQHDALIVYADRDKLLQALLNIVSNGARHASKHIYIQAGIEQGRVVLNVADDGEGIAEDLLPNLFHRFVKGKNGESGLGLAISRAIVERCGGLITAANREEGGAVISLGFPPYRGRLI
ncbi:HAMP domain-containing sensor histidine kinase [Paenibacillus sp. JCM 10914]|uniref:sensor histidine kinase n=1 Tax=Paenibacillus sp. JCM 10914 TaxID=1236974 RepID=UPI0003CC866B|nr:HAMP domain-containing sensor histidine kinase [Paenibacillus sp. JCM 10914]GAE06086.1 sensor histidine kinase [Paenibacillus sp. JCM 10914]